METKNEEMNIPQSQKTGLLNSSYFWALIFAVAIGGWMASGNLVIGGQSSENTDANQTAAASKQTGKNKADTKLFSVKAKTFHAKQKRAVLNLRGHTEADATVPVRAQTSGIVLELPVRKGQLVDKGKVLCRIETGARQATLLEAKAMFAEAEANFKATSKLAARGHTAELKVAEMQAKQDAAQAAITRAELDLERTEIKAPFRGLVEEQSAKVGAFLNIGDSCAHLVSTNPLIIVGSVSEQDISALQPGMEATAELVTGETVTGKIRFVSSSSDNTTKTFRTELEIPNPDFHLKDGITANIKIGLGSTNAHRFTPALLGLDDEGRIGVRTLTSENIVKFVPVKILSEATNGVWVSGLPQNVTVITVGQDYVIDGQKVNAIIESSAASS